MQLTVLGGTGAVGTHLIRSALDRGHTVTAIARTVAALPDNVRAVHADLATATPDDLTAVIAGADAVVSALGPRSNAEAGVATAAMSATISAMNATGVRRLVVTSAAPVGSVATPLHPDRRQVEPGSGVVGRVAVPLLIRALRPTYADLAAMEDVVTTADDLDWTIARPPRLTDGAPRGGCRTSLDGPIPGGNSIARADLAHFLLDAVDDSTLIGQVVRVAR